MLTRRRTTAVLLCAALIGCTGETPGPSPAETQSRELTGESEAAERVVLEAEDGEPTLAGVLEPVPPRTDAHRVIALDTHPSGIDLHGERVLDARTVSDGVVAIGADRVLRHYTARSTVELDRGVLAPLSVEAGHVAYVRGVPPDLHLFVAELSTGRVEPIAPHLAPVWSPALSEDGREIVFATAAEGRPQLFRSDASGQLQRVHSDRTPSSPRAPIWRDGVVTFEDEQGTVSVSLETARIEETEVR
jgi:hypothetical protein